MELTLRDQLAPIAEAQFMNIGIETSGELETAPAEEPNPEPKSDTKPPKKTKTAAKTATAKPKTSTKIRKVTPAKSVAPEAPVVASVEPTRATAAPIATQSTPPAKVEPITVASSTWKRVAMTIPESFRTRGAGDDKSLDLFFPMGTGHCLRVSVTGLAADFEAKRGDTLVGTLVLNDTKEHAKRYMSATFAVHPNNVLAERKFSLHESGERSAGWLFVHRLRTGGLFEIALPDGSCST